MTREPLKVVVARLRESVHTRRLNTADLARVLDAVEAWQKLGGTPLEILLLFCADPVWTRNEAVREEATRAHELLKTARAS